MERIRQLAFRFALEYAQGGFMRLRSITIGLVLLPATVALVLAQRGQDLFTQGLGREKIGDYQAAIKVYERIIQDFPRDHSLVGKAKLHIGDSWLKLGEAKGMDFLNDVIHNYGDLTDVVSEAKRLAALTGTRPPKWTDKDALMVAEFENHTGIAAFDGYMDVFLTQLLTPSPYVNIVPRDHVREVLTRSGLPPDGRVTHAVARAICDKTGARGTLLSSISGSDANFKVSLNVVNCSSGELTASSATEAASRTEVIGQLSRAASLLRADLGESAESIRQTENLGIITTNSPEALQAYMEGYKLRSAGDLQHAMTSLIRATTLDRNFAL